MQREVQFHNLPFAKRVAFSLVPLLFIFLVLEIGFRLSPGLKNAEEPVTGIVEPDRELLWRLEPHVDGPLKTNDLGFRDRPLNDQAAVRILLLGDSVSWGDGIDDMEEVYPQLAEELLRSGNPDETVEIVNSAVPGYSTFQELRYLELYGLRLDPDLIILQFCLNDVVERYVSLAQYGGDRVFLGIDTRKAIPGLFGWLVRHSRAFETIARKIIELSRDKQEYEVRNLAQDHLSGELEEAWATVTEEIDGIRTLAEKSGIPLLMIIPPYKFQLDDPADRCQPQARLQAHADRHGIMTIDLLPHFESFRLLHSDVELFNDSSHLSIEGHELAARVVANRLGEILHLDTGANRRNGNGTSGTSWRTCCRSPADRTCAVSATERSI